MAFTVEDGTGTVSGANSYGTVAGFKSYHNDRGNSITGLSSSDIQKLLIKGTDYIDQRWGPNIKGFRLEDGQPLEFPRDSLYSYDGNLLEGLPTKLVSACYEYALSANSGDLWLTPTVDASGAKVQRTKIGPIETEFAEGASQSVAKSWPKADYLMAEFVTGGSGAGSMRN